MAFIYMTHHYPGDFVSLPIYKIKEDSIYRTHHHPDGYLAAAVMKVHGDSVFMTHQYPAKFIFAPIFEIRGTSIYMTPNHPDSYIDSDIMEIKHPQSRQRTVSDAVLDKSEEMANPEAEVLEAALDLGSDDKHA